MEGETDIRQTNSGEMKKETNLNAGVDTVDARDLMTEITHKANKEETHAQYVALPLEARIMTSRH